MDADSANNFVALRVNDADVVGFSVGDVNLVAGGIGRDPSWTRTHCDGLYIFELQQIKDADRVALSVGDVGVLVVSGIELLLPAAARCHQGRSEEHTSELQSLRHLV